MLKVNAIYPAIQGEGEFTGYPMVIVRLWGCSVGCPWCDSRETWGDSDSVSAEVASVNGLVPGSPFWANVDERHLLDFIRNAAPNMDRILLTGGEPCEQDLTEFYKQAFNRGYHVHLETSGTAPIPDCPLGWVTLSPKFGMPGGKVPSTDWLRVASEVKMPVGKLADLHALFRFIGEGGENARKVPVWLQPLAGSKAAFNLCLQEAKALNMRLSIQTHKLVGEP